MEALLAIGVIGLIAALRLVALDRFSTPTAPGETLASSPCPSP